MIAQRSHRNAQRTPARAARRRPVKGRSVYSSGLRTRRGFTLIELMATMAIIGTLASAAMSTFKQTKRNAFDAQVSADARSLAVAEEAYFGSLGTYTADAGDLLVIGSPGSEVTITAGNSGSIESSFSVRVTHPSMKYENGCVWTSDSSPTMTCS